ncbi:MAG: hypothetical protein IH607_00130, partial [Firmicutes bacterium]|nr:hypothetical protein [Bacillota bacterium]
ETTVGHINRVSASSGTIAYYEVTCDLTVPPEVLPGMRATVSIASQSVEGVTVLPLAALGFLDDGSAYTLMKSATDSYEQLPLETGLSDGMLVEITAGVNAGDMVYAVSGTQSAEAGFSLSDMYRAIAGEKVVINETFQQHGDWQMPAGFDGAFPSGTWPGGMDGTDGTDDTTGTFGDMQPPVDNTQASQTGTDLFADIPQPQPGTDTTQSDTDTGLNNP